MKLITRDSDYALRAILYIAEISKKEKGLIISVDEIVKELDLPKEHTRLLLKKLAENKILKSYKGRKGGFTLLEPANKISVAEILEIFQGDIDSDFCVLKNEPCPNIKQNCRLRARLKKINSLIKDEFKKSTIESLIK